MTNFAKTVTILGVWGIVLASRSVAAEPDAIGSLAEYLKQDASERTALDEVAFAKTPLSREQAAAAQQMLWDDHVKRVHAERAEEMKARRLKVGDLEMPFYYKVFGDKPKGGRSLYISLHGGGGAPARVNDSQWENQKRLYSLKEGVYLVPRAATNTWNLWHQGHIDGMFDRLIENMIVFEDVNPNRVYVMGYSAGGDGVFQLAPRMADRWAAAAMMAGHPNETSPLGLRNIAFTIHMGGRDAAYNRNKKAAEWDKQLADLRKADPEGYVHLVKIYPDKGHWMDREDASALPWMAKFERNPLPKRIVWKQDDVTHSRFYWLAVDGENRKARAEIVANIDGQRIQITSNEVKKIVVRLTDDMLDLDQPVSIMAGEKKLFEGRVQRSAAVIARTLRERGDPKSVFSAEVTVSLP